MKSILQEDLYRGLERALAGDFQGNMRRVLKKSQEWETDITGIGQHVRVQQPRWFREKEWSAVFGECQINVEVKVRTVTNPDF